MDTTTHRRLVMYRITRTTTVWLGLALAAAVVAGCGDPAVSDAPADTGGPGDTGVLPDGHDPTDPDATDPDGSVGEICTSDRTFFEEELWPQVVGPICTACHAIDGAAGASQFILENIARPDYLEVNRERMADLSRTQRDGVSVLLLKPRGEMTHGGGVQLPADSPQYALLEAFVARVASPDNCPTPDPGIPWEGVVLDDPATTLRRASLALLGRLPTTDEYASVESGGLDGLRLVLDAMMDDEAFYARVASWYDDVLWTERYAINNRANNALDDQFFVGRYWYEGIETQSIRDQMASRANQAIARQPVALIQHILREHRPFTEILTADYVMVNDFSALSLGVSSELPDLDDPNALAFREARIPDYPHAGLLTATSYLARFPSTPTNRNRHRSRIFFDRFLATDILSLADRPIDPTFSDYHNPTLNDPQCTVCHAMLDPVAGLFQNWDDAGRPRPSDWYPEMAVPGFGGQIMPSNARGHAVRWLAEQTVADRRFALATVHTVYKGLIGRPPLRPVDPADPDATETARRAFQLQRTFFEATATAFVENDASLREVVRAILLSPYFRAQGATDSARPEAVVEAGRARWLTPEELDRKITAVTGYPWRSRWSSNNFLSDRYRMLFGGVDYDGVTSRLSDPNGIMVSIAERMAWQHVCRAVPLDFAMQTADRRLFGNVEASFVPETPEGFEIPQAVASIRQTIQHLHAHILDEALALDDAEIDATYQLFLETWREGAAGVAAGDISRDLPWQCRADTDPWTGNELPEARRLGRDESYTIRAWSAVVAYLMTDYRFLHD